MSTSVGPTGVSAKQEPLLSFTEIISPIRSRSSHPPQPALSTNCCLCLWLMSVCTNKTRKQCFSGLFWYYSRRLIRSFAVRKDPCSVAWSAAWMGLRGLARVLSFVHAQVTNMNTEKMTKWWSPKQGLSCTVTGCLNGYISLFPGPAFLRCNLTVKQN